MQRGLGSGAEYHLYVVENINCRIQVFNPVDGSPIRCIGGAESGPGQLFAPTSCEALLGAERDIAELYVCDRDILRVNVFDMTTGAFKRHIDSFHSHSEPWGDGYGLPCSNAWSLGGVDSQGGDHLLYVSECDGKEDM